MASPAPGQEGKDAILYSLVARGDNVLTECSMAGVKGNFQQITIDVLKRIDPFTSRKMSFSYDDKVHFHLSIESGLIFLCMSDVNFAKRRAYSFLIDIRNTFLSKFGEDWKTALPLAFNAQFCRQLEQKMNYYSFDPSSDRVTAVQAEIDQLKSVTTEMIEKIIERGEKIDMLVEKTQTLSDQTFQFKDKAKVLKLKLWWRNLKCWLCICCLLLIVVFCVVWFACGFPDFKDCGGGPKPAGPSTTIIVVPPPTASGDPPQDVPVN
jgi:vesicle-associated membrane protein 7